MPKKSKKKKQTKSFYKNLKNLKYGLTALLLISILFLLFVNVDDYLDTSEADKKIEAENMAVYGYQKGYLSWLLKARYIWSSYSLDHSVVENIYDGRLYDQGKTVLKNFSAKKVWVDAPQERLTATNGVLATLIRNYDGKQEDVSVWAEQLQYFSDQKKSYLRQKIRVKDQESSIDADYAEINHEDNIVTFSNNFNFYHGQSQGTGEKMLVNINKQEFKILGKAQLIRSADKNSKDEFRRKDTKVQAEEITFKVTSNNADALLKEQVIIWQEDKQGLAKEAIFIEKEDKLILKNEAVLVFDKTDWLIDEKTKQKIKNQEAKEALTEKVTLKADQLTVSTETKDVQGQGKVWVGLKRQEAKADYATYSRQDEKIYLTENVTYKKIDGSWVQAGKVVVDINKESIIADGQAEGHIILKR